MSCVSNYIFHLKTILKRFDKHKTALEIQVDQSTSALTWSVLPQVQRWTWWTSDSSGPSCECYASSTDTNTDKNITLSDKETLGSNYNRSDLGGVKWAWASWWWGGKVGQDISNVPNRHLWQCQLPLQKDDHPFTSWGHTQNIKMQNTSGNHNYFHINISYIMEWQALIACGPVLERQNLKAKLTEVQHQWTSR